jgi:hypothetical protein
MQYLTASALDRSKKCATLEVTQSHTKTMTTLPAHDRQHYIPSPRLMDSERHWMLDMVATRDLLKTLLRKRTPQARVPFFGTGAEFDFALDLLIDELGARSLPQPKTPWEMVRVSGTCLKHVLLIELRSIRTW